MGGFVIKHISNKQNFKFICIRPTGSGKGLLYQVLALYVRKITLCITLILALGANQMRKVLQIPDANITAFHMDELTDANVLKFKRHLEVLHNDNSVIILASPQFLNNQGTQFLSFLHQCKLICIVFMDELHLLHHFARSFRHDFDQLTPLIFRKIHCYNPCIFMTATCSEKIIALSQRIFGFQITHRDRPTIKGMANRKQAFVATYTPVGICYIYEAIQKHLGKNNLDSQGCLLPDKQMYYGNSCNSFKALAEKLEHFLDSFDGLHNFDVLVHGRKICIPEAFQYMQWGGHEV